MNQQKIIFENSPAFLLGCVVLGIGYAWLLYRAPHHWSNRLNQLLFLLRAALVAFISFLLIGPILKLTHNITERPALAILIDNSGSIRETQDSAALNRMRSDWELTKKTLEDKGYEVGFRTLSSDEQWPANFRLNTSDLAGAIRDVAASYEGKNLAGIILLSDGIYNSGISPLYSPVKVPVYTVGMGDTTQRVDLVLRNIGFNKIAYQGNQFPVRAEVLVQDLPHRDITLTIQHGGKRQVQTKNTENKTLLEFDFRLDATEKGLQRIDISIEPLLEESNKKNNQGSAFVEVMEGKKKILLIAPAPHPDIKALRSTIEKNSNNEFHLHIPGVKEAEASLLQPGKADLVIFHQAIDTQGKTQVLFTRLGKGPSSVLMMLGSRSNFRQLRNLGVPLSFDNVGQWDEITPIVNPSYAGFGVSESTYGIFSGFPPVTVPFGKFSYPPNASVLLQQRIGNVTTDRPMIFTYDENNHKAGVILGEGIWRWRLNEFSETEKTEAFDEVFSRLIQYLSTQEDKRKFRSFPIQHEFTDAEPGRVESQVYNDLYEQVYGNKIEIEVRDEKGKATKYSYVTGAGSVRYRMGACGKVCIATRPPPKCRVSWKLSRVNSWSRHRT